MKRQYLSLKDNFNLCEHLRSLKDFFEKEKPTFKVAMQILSKKIGKPVGPDSLRQAMEATGVQWKAFRSSPDKVAANTARRALVEAVAYLFEQMGLLPPISFVQAKTYYCGNGRRQEVLPLLPT